MAPSPTKSRTVHKSSGKPPRYKEKDRLSAAGSSVGNGMETVYTNGVAMTIIKKDEILEAKDIPLTLPEAGPLEQGSSLPIYTEFLRGSLISIDELDSAQLELELLMSSIKVRQTSFSHQSEIIDHLDKGRLPPKVPASPGKRAGCDIDRPTKRLKDNNGRARDAQTGAPTSRPSKVKCSVVKNEPLFDVPDIAEPEAPKVAPAKNDMINRFWQMVNQYCQEITADDIKILEELMNSQNDESDYLKIVPLGKHYSLRWAQEDIMDEQKEGLKVLEKRKIKMEPGTDGCQKFLREVDMNGCNDDVTPLGPLTQRVIAGLVEESVISPENIENKAVQGVGVGRPGFIRNLGLGNTNSLEKRIKRELQDQGILDADSCTEDEDDEILGELRRAQVELKSITAHNQLQLTRLLKHARQALVRHDLKKRLSDVDAKVIETHRFIASNKLKKKPPSKKDKDAAWKLLKEREALIKQLDAVPHH